MASIAILVLTILAAGITGFVVGVAWHTWRVRRYLAKVSELADKLQAEKEAALYQLENHGGEL